MVCLRNINKQQKQLNYEEMATQVGIQASGLDRCHCIFLEAVCQLFNVYTHVSKTRVE